MLWLAVGLPYEKLAVLPNYALTGYMLCTIEDACGDS